MITNHITTKPVFATEFEDIRNHTHKVYHSVLLNDEQRKEREEQIVEELYKIFTHKAV